MKKILYGFLVLILVLLVAIYTLLFTSFGNGIVANYAQNKIKQNTGLDLNITRFDLRFSSLNLEASLADLAKLNLEGNLSLLSLGFDLSYLINFDKNYAKTMGLNLDKNLEFQGDIKGKASDFIVNGKGYLLGSHVLLDSRIYNYSPIALNLDAKNLKIEDIEHLLNSNEYLKGNIDIMAKIEAKDLKPDGNAIIKLYTNSINYEQIKKDFGIDLPKKSELNSEILATIKENQIYAVSKTSNDYLNLQTQKTLYDLTKNTLNTDFELKIPNLAKLESLTQTKLNGALNVMGNLSLLNNALNTLDASIDGLGGDVNASLKDNKLVALLKDVKLERLLALAGYGSLAQGNLNAHLQSMGLDFKNFNAVAQINNAKINPSEIKRLTKLDFPNNSFSLDAKANAKNGVIDYNALLASNLLNIKKLNGTYNLNNNELKVDTQAFIDDLSQFNALSGQKLQGNLALDSKAHLIGSNIQNLNADFNLAGGSIKANSNGKTLDLDISKLDLEKLFVITGMPNYANGLINAKGHLNSIDFKNLNGNVNLEAKGLLNATTLSKILEKKFPNNTSYDLKADINLKNNIANFDSSLKSSLANLTHFKGSFDINKILLNSDFVLDVSDFSKLGFLLDRKLSGKALFNGKLDFDKGINASIKSENLFEGKLDSTLKNNVLNANLTDVELSNLTKSFDLSDIYQGRASLNVNYNLLSENGQVNLNMKEGRLKQNAITNAIKLITLKDITDDVFHTAKADATIRKELIDFNLNMQAQRSNIQIAKGNFNSKNGTLNVPFEAKLDRADFKGVITGTSENPKVKLDTKSVVNTLKNVIGGQESNSHKENKPVNKLLKKIF
ncbi:hypothetical protein [Campylobacter cuniculorum]|uniref:Periplasmic protein n=2 Tax=Campylobacter cuniculorum TaxID=374106 RepID=A0A1W6BXT8_9BACT|nr:hypothetical protein [Campylobacter cuniculorum]ARJ56887.1 hypothetical protein CCUN_1298 [Campylobacter cuniculorum DSM 23162 = LMG 24588]QOR04349.1 hypothetical protein A0071_09405 [Campylobacter cuniculorum]